MLNLNKNPLVGSTNFSVQSLGSDSSKNSSSEFSTWLDDEPVAQDITIEQPPIGGEDMNVSVEMMGIVQLPTENVVPHMGNETSPEVHANSQHVLETQTNPHVMSGQSTDTKITDIASEVFAAPHSSVASAILPLTQNALRSTANIKWTNSNSLSMLRSEEQSASKNSVETEIGETTRVALPAEEIVSFPFTKNQHKSLDTNPTINFKNMDNVSINQVAKALTDTPNPIAGLTLLGSSTQTLVDVIRDNSSWTTHLSEPKVQSTSIVKADGGVLQSLKVQLNPIELGKVELHLRMINGQMQVEVRPETEKTFLNLAMEQENLLSTLKGLGFKVDSVSIISPTSTQNSQHHPSLESGGRHSNEHPKHEPQDSSESQKQLKEVGYASNHLADTAMISKDVI